MSDSIFLPWRKYFPGCIVFLMLVAAAAAGSAQTGTHSTPKIPIPASSEDGSGAYATGQYRNLFAEDGHTPAEIHAKIEAAYNQLFHGDPQSQAVVFAAGKNANGPLLYLTDWANHDVRTEGMSYGMMIAVQMGKKAEFDALWNWAMSYMYIGDPRHPSYHYFSWSCKTDGTANEETPAPDGEEYFAMALLFAGNRWPGGHGIYDYRAQALDLLRAMRHRAILQGETKRGHREVGAEVNEQNAMILFVPGVMAHPFTDPSYHLPGFYELWARWGPQEDREFWLRAAEASRAYFPKAANPQTGLTPVYSNFDGTPYANRFDQSDKFGYDAYRSASNWSVDWSWWRKAPVERELSDRIQQFFLQQGIDSYGPLYYLDGKPYIPTNSKPDHPTGLVGANAVAGLAATDTKTARKFTEALWNAPIPSGQFRYYDGMLYLMSLLHLSGEFRIWGPQQ